MSTKPLSKAAEARAKAATIVAAEQDAEFNSFKETYNARLFTVAELWDSRVYTDMGDSVTFDSDGFTFRVHSTGNYYKNVELPRELIDLATHADVEYELGKLEAHIKSLDEAERVRKELLTKTEAAKIKAQALFSDEELKLLNIVVK